MKSNLPLLPSPLSQLPMASGLFALRSLAKPMEYFNAARGRATTMESEQQRQLS